MLLLVSAPTESLAEDYFTVEMIDDPNENTDYQRFVLKNPFETGEAANFLVFGMHGIYGRAFRHGHKNNSWGEYTSTSYPQSLLAWMTDQVKFFFAKNINTMGAKSNDEVNDTEWFDQDAEENYPTDCIDSEHRHHLFGTAKIGESVYLHKEVNARLGNKHDEEPEDFPRTYFPYLTYIYITQPLYKNKLVSFKKDSTMPGWQMVPDVWNPYFAQESFLKTFLVLSDGVPESGRWEYYDGDYPDVVSSPTPVLRLPDFWQCHAPQAMKDQQALIAIILGYDVPHYWGEVKLPSQDHVSLLRTWMRALLAQRYDPADDFPIPPARTEFVDAMCFQYTTDVGLTKEEGIPIWNHFYSGYEIDFWYLADDPSPEPDLDRILETKDLFDVDQGDEHSYRYPDGYFPNEPDGTYANWLQDPNQDDLGSLLNHQPVTLPIPYQNRHQTISDAESFKKKMTEKHHQVAIDAIRFFDPNHMIFSECSNWTSGRMSGNFDNYDPSGVIQKIMETRGNHFPDDKISAMTTQIYPQVPEKDVELADEDGFYVSYKTKCGNIFHIVKEIYNNTDPHLIVPFLIGSYTIHADWEKEWDFNWDYGGSNQRCPWEDDEYRIIDDWLEYAPLPHGDRNVQGDRRTCLEPTSYRYTETGLLEWYDEAGGSDTHYGRGMDFNIVSSALLTPMTFGVSSQVVVFLGLVFHDYYDTGYNSGSFQIDSENWGFVNQTKRLGETDPDSMQYYMLHDRYHLRAGAIQVHHSGGEPWSLDGATYPDDPLEIDEYFGAYGDPE